MQQQVEAQIKQLFLQKQVIAKRQQPQPQMDSKTGIFSILTNAHIPRQLIQQQQQQQQVEPTITPQEHQQIEQQVRRQMQRQQQMVHQQSRKFPYLAFTPAIDVAVLRQVFIKSHLSTF